MLSEYSRQKRIFQSIILKLLSKNMSAKHKEGTISQIAAPYDALFELGKAYRINYKFDKAKETFTKYSGTLLPDDQENH